jgi:hypothetical protein
MWEEDDYVNVSFAKDGYEVFYAQLTREVAFDLAETLALTANEA